MEEHISLSSKRHKMNCVFAGTFDPINKGHEKIILSLLADYEKVFVVLGKNKDKSPIFTEEERLMLLKATFSDYEKIEIVDYSKIKDYSNFLKEKNISIYVRGIRNKEDLSYEKEYEKINKELYPFLTTKYIEIDDYKEISSTLIRDAIKQNKDISQLVPEKCVNLINDILKKN